jgi:hypothetical protein
MGSLMFVPNGTTYVASIFRVTNNRGEAAATSNGHVLTSLDHPAGS